MARNDTRVCHGFGIYLCMDIGTIIPRKATGFCRVYILCQGLVTRDPNKRYNARISKFPQGIVYI